MTQKRDGEDQLKRSVKNEEAICIAKKESNIVYTRKKGRISMLVTSCVGTTFYNTKTVGRIKVMGRRGRRRKDLIDGLKEMRIYCKLYCFTVHFHISISFYQLMHFYCD